jgi:hypothetical protein
MAILRRFNGILTGKDMNTPYGKHCPDVSLFGQYDGRMITKYF